jgi:hypothetical protein
MGIGTHRQLHENKDKTGNIIGGRVPHIFVYFYRSPASSLNKIIK